MKFLPVAAATASAIWVMSASLKFGVMRCCCAGGWPPCWAPAGCANASEAAQMSGSVLRAKK
jgi:hypothetical protein